VKNFVQSINPGMDDLEPSVKDKDMVCRVHDVEDRGPGVKDGELGVKDRDPSVEDRKPGVKERDPGVEDRNLGTKDRDPALED
jgi:hypothetical protein